MVLFMLSCLWLGKVAVLFIVVVVFGVVLLSAPLRGRCQWLRCVVPFYQHTTVIFRRIAAEMSIVVAGGLVGGCWIS